MLKPHSNDSLYGFFKFLVFRYTQKSLRQVSICLVEISMHSIGSWLSIILSIHVYNRMWLFRNLITKIDHGVNWKRFIKTLHWHEVKLISVKVAKIHLRSTSKFKWNTSVALPISSFCYKWESLKMKYFTVPWRVKTLQTRHGKKSFCYFVNIHVDDDVSSWNTFFQCWWRR